MKKKGFTLVELLAIIVILGIIMSIATPIIIKIINDSKKETYKLSMSGYVRAVEEQIAVNKAKGKITKNGNYNIKNFEVGYSGRIADKGSFSINNELVISAQLCFDTYLVKYDGKEVTLTEKGCEKEATVNLVIGEKKYDNVIKDDIETEFNISDDISDMTNIVCNNGATISMNGNTLKLSDVYKDTNCTMSSSINTTFAKLDNTKNYILMLKDENVSETLIIKENKNVTFDLNGKNITALPGCQYTLRNFGKLTINDSTGTGVMKTTRWLLANRLELTINGGSFIKEKDDESGGGVIGNSGLVTVNDGYFYAKSAYVFYNYFINDPNPIFNVNGGIIKSPDSPEFANTHSKETFNIKNVNLSDLGDKIVFDNHAGGIFNISNVQIDNTSPYTVYNAKQGIINIKNSTITNSSGSTIDNTDDGIINIVDCKFDAMLNVVDNNKLGTVNICSGSINGKTNDVINKGNGYVYYKDSNIFKNNSLNDTVNDPSHIILKSDLICEAK